MKLAQHWPKLSLLVQSVPLYSLDGQVQLKMQADGNLVL